MQVKDEDIEYYECIVGIEDNITKIGLVEQYQQMTRLDKHVKEDFEDLMLKLGLPLPNIELGRENVDYFYIIDAELEVATEGFFSAIGDFISKLVKWVIDKFNQFTDWLFGIVNEKEEESIKDTVKLETSLEILLSKVEKEKNIKRFLSSKELDFINKLDNGESDITLDDIPGLKEKDVKPIIDFMDITGNDVDNINNILEDIRDSVEAYIERIDEVREYIDETDPIEPTQDELASYFRGLIAFAYDLVNTNNGINNFQLDLITKNEAPLVNGCVTGSITVYQDKTPTLGAITEAPFVVPQVNSSSSITLGDCREKFNLTSSKIKTYDTNFGQVELKRDDVNICNLVYSGERAIRYFSGENKPLERKVSTLNKKINKASLESIKILTATLRYSLKEYKRVSKIAIDHKNCLSLIDKTIKKFINDKINELNKIED